jgi:hypothetical protein
MIGQRFRIGGKTVGVMLLFQGLQSDLLLRIVARDTNVRWIACTSHCATVSDSMHYVAIA